jgi:hypothetical protein
MAKKKLSPDEPKIPEPGLPDFGPLIEDLLAVAKQSVQRNGEQALGVWKQITKGDYEPKMALQDTAKFLSATAKDAAKTFNLFGKFIEKLGEDGKPAAAK